MKNIQIEIKGLNKEMDQATQAIRSLVKEMKSLQPVEIKSVTEETKKGAKSIADLQAAYSTMASGIVGENLKTTFSDLKKEMEEQLNMMRVAGNTGSEEYKKLSKSLNDLNAAQSATTQGIKFTNEAMAGLEMGAQAFELLRDGAQVFGVENDKINKGLQAGNQAFSFMKTITGLATKAQKLFNAAMAANPVMLIVAGIAALAAGIYAFIKATDNSVDSVKEANEKEKERLKTITDTINKKKEEGKTAADAIQHELNLMKAKGDSQIAISKKEQELHAQRVANAQEIADEAEKEIQDIDANKNKLEALKKTLEEVSDGKKKKVEFEVDGKVKKIKADEAKDLLKQQIESLETSIKVGVDASEGLEKAQKQQEIAHQNNVKLARERAKTEAAAAAEVRLLEANKGGLEELNARINLIETQKKMELQNAELTASERKRITLKAEEDILAAKKDFLKRQLEDEKVYLDTMLLQAQAGSREELGLKQQQLEKQKEIELSNSDLTENQKEYIRVKYQKQAEELNKAFLSQQAASELNTQVSLINAQLANAKEGSEQEKTLKSSLVTFKEEADKQAAMESISNKKELEAKLLEITTAANKEREEIDSAYRLGVIEKEKEAELERIEKMQLELEQMEEDSFNKWEIKEKYRELEKEALAIEEEALLEKRELGLISEDEYLAQMGELKGQYRDLEIAAEEEKAAKMQEIQDGLNQLVTGFFDMKKEFLQAELDDLVAKKEAGLITEEQFAEEEKKLKEKMAKADKQKAIFDALMNAAVAVTKSLAAAPFPFNIALAAATAVKTAIEVNKIKNSQPPKYWKGRKSGSGEFALVGEYGAELMYIPSGASIMPHNATREALAGNSSVMKSWNMPAIEMPSVLPALSQAQFEQYKKSKEDTLDYKLLARMIGENVAENIHIPQVRGDVHVNVDKNGISVINGNDTMLVKNKRYGSIL